MEHTKSNNREGDLIRSIPSNIKHVYGRNRVDPRNVRIVWTETESGAMTVRRAIANLVLVSSEDLLENVK